MVPREFAWQKVYALGNCTGRGRGCLWSRGTFDPSLEEHGALCSLPSLPVLCRDLQLLLPEASCPLVKSLPASVPEVSDTALLAADVRLPTTNLEASPQSDHYSGDSPQETCMAAGSFRSMLLTKWCVCPGQKQACPWTQ